MDTNPGLTIIILVGFCFDFTIRLNYGKNELGGVISVQTAELSGNSSLFSERFKKTLLILRVQHQPPYPTAKSNGVLVNFKIISAFGACLTLPAASLAHRIQVSQDTQDNETCWYASYSLLMILIPYIKYPLRLQIPT